jgi:hypothetical protein
MGYFTDEALRKLREEFNTVLGKLVGLQERYLQMEFANERGEYQKFRV